MGRVMNYIGKNPPVSLWWGWVHITAGVQQQQPGRFPKKAACRAACV